MTEQKHPTRSGRAVAVLAMAVLVAGALAGSSATAAKKPLTKQKAKKIFYTKKAANSLFVTQGGADQRFLNVGEVGSSFAQATTLIQNFTGPDDVLSSSVTVPSAGQLLIWANVSFEEDEAPNPVHATVLVDGTQVGTVQESNIENEGFFASESIANAVSATVTPGAHTVALNLESPEGSEIAVEGRSILTLFIPSA